MEWTMRKLMITMLCLAGLMIATATTAAATVSPTTGQPGAPANTCGTSNPVMPGSSVNASGSPFNPNGQAGVVYAGNPNTASFTNSNSTVSVSQYDSACVHLSNPPG